MLTRTHGLLSVPAVPVILHPGFVDGERDREDLKRFILSCDSPPEPGSPRYQGAMILLSSVQMRHSVDSIARFCILPRDFVAQCARRLYDNGVWEKGQVRCSWSSDAAPSPEFWADVSVALGKLCRRRDQDGSLHWAAPGYWTKSYSFTDLDAMASTTTTYSARPDPPRQPEGEARRAGAESGESAEVATEMIDSAPPVSSLHLLTKARSARFQEPFSIGGASDAVWLQ